MNTPLNPLLTSGDLDRAMDVLNTIRIYNRSSEQDAEDSSNLDVSACLRAANCYRAVGADDKAEVIMETLYSRID